MSVKVPAALQWPFDGHDTAEVVLYRARLLFKAATPGTGSSLPQRPLVSTATNGVPRLPRTYLPPTAQLRADAQDSDEIESSPTLPGSSRGVPQVPPAWLTTHAGTSAVGLPQMVSGPDTFPAAAQLPAEGHDTDTTGESGPLLRIVEPGQVTAVSQTPSAAVITSALLETDPPAAQ